MPNMKLGLNRDLNTETKKCGCALWTAALKKLKAKQPSFQSNPQGGNETAKKGASHYPNPILATRFSDHKSRHKQGADRYGSSSCLETLTVALEELFYKKGDHSKSYKPGVFRQK